jgi:hypothetical protein
LRPLFTKATMLSFEAEQKYISCFIDFIEKFGKNDTNTIKEKRKSFQVPLNRYLLNFINK